MKTIHLISHTHWDREWYRPFQLFRLRLVHLVDGLLDILATDRAYKHFMLDGQTIVLDDYLLMRPEAESTLTDHIRAGRVLIGPWHILPDMFLVSLNDAVSLTGGVRWLARWGFYEPTALGARLSPLNGRFPISIRASAMEEAKKLTEEKVKL